MTGPSINRQQQIYPCAGTHYSQDYRHQPCLAMGVARGQYSVRCAGMWITHMPSVHCFACSNEMHGRPLPQQPVAGANPTIFAHLGIEEPVFSQAYRHVCTTCQLPHRARDCSMNPDSSTYKQHRGLPQQSGSQQAPPIARP